MLYLLTVCYRTSVHCQWSYLWLTVVGFLFLLLYSFPPLRPPSERRRRKDTEISSRRASAEVSVADNTDQLAESLSGVDLNKGDPHWSSGRGESQRQSVLMKNELRDFGTPV